MEGPMLNTKVSRLLLKLLLLLLYICISVADKEAEEWGEWGACAVTCGTGQRSRVGCTQKQNHGHKCPPGHVTTQTEMCSTASCSPSVYSPQAQSSPGVKTSSIVMLLSSSAPFSSSLILTSSSPRKTSPFVLASSTRMITSSSESVVLMPSTQFNQVSLKRTTTSAQTSRLTETSSSLALMSSSPIMTSSVVSYPLHAKYSSSLPSSSRLMMTSSSSSMILMSPTKSSQELLKSTASSRSPSSRNDTNNDEPSSRQAYFNGAEENWILKNHVIKDTWTSSEITCAMLCLRDNNCQSINFKSTAKNSRQTKHTNAKKYPNCQLNSAKHLEHPRDFFAKRGYRYYYLI